MLPVFTIVGRPNVGKSTLFNVLTKSRDALVANQPGVTRDRQYGEGMEGNNPFIVVDTGGIAEFDDSNLTELTEQQVQQAVDEADIILFMVDAKIGLASADQEIARRLRDHQKKVILVVNKVDRKDAATASSEFYALGFDKLYAISAASSRGIATMMKALLKEFPPVEALPAQEMGIAVAIVGRPNVGKSTLINRMLGEDRVIVFNEPGTTRDSIFIPFERRGKKYTLIDTAGVRRRSKIDESIEKFSVIKTMQAMEKAHVVILILDASEGITEQDMRLISLIIKMGKAFIVVANKWDGLSGYQRQQVKENLNKRLAFVTFAKRYFISAQQGDGVGELFGAILEAYKSATADLSTPDLTRILEKAVHDHQPPAVKGRRIRLRYAHLGGHHPLIIVVHGKQTDSLPASYQTYLANYFRKAFDLVGVPVHIHLKNDANPYAKNKLSRGKKFKRD